MKRKLFLVITTAIVLSVLLLYISCPSELGVDDTYEDNLLTSTLTPMIQSSFLILHRL